jgi:predicted nucleic acid-binding protein
VCLAVIDASVLTAYYASDDPRREAVTARLASGDALFAPAHLDAEVVSALRGVARVNAKVRRAVPAALARVAGFPIRRMPLPPLLQRMWELRGNVTPSDAAYVAPAEQLSGPLITCNVDLAQGRSRLDARSIRSADARASPGVSSRAMVRAMKRR